MVAIGIVIAILEFCRCRVQELNAVGGTELCGSGGPTSEVAKGGLDETGLATLRAVLHF